MVRCLPFLILTVATNSVLAQDALEWKFATGDELRYEIVQQTNLEVDARDAGAFTTDATQTMDILWRIDSVDGDGTMTATQVIERIRVNIQQQDGLELVYDSDDQDAPAGLSAMLTPMFESLLENEVTVVVTARGEVEEVKLPEAMEKRLAGIPATRAMSNLVTGAGLRRVAEQIALLLPAEGEDSARRPLVIENRVLGTLTGELTWKTSGNEGDLHQFEPSIELSVKPNEEIEDDSYQPVKPMVDPKITEQSAAGTAEFDAAAGKLTKSKLELKLALTGQLMGADVESDVTQTVEVTAK